jgi:CHAT domain-containing protein
MKQPSLEFQKLLRDASAPLRTSDSNAIVRYLSVLKAVISHKEFASLESDLKYSILDTVGSGSYQRYEMEGELDDLNWALRCSREAVKQVQIGSPQWVGGMHQIGVQLRKRFDHAGDLRDLNDAIDAAEQAVKHSPAESINLPICLNSLGHALKRRYQLTRELPDLQRAVEVYERAITLSPPGSQVRPMVLNGLGNILGIRYDVNGNFADLEGAIQALEEALQGMPAGSFAQASAAHNLSAKLQDRFELTNHIDDLKRAIELSTQSVDNTPPNSPGITTHLTGLANAFNRYYEYTDDPIYLDKSLEVLEGMAARTNIHSTNYAGITATLAGVLNDRYKRQGELADIERAIHILEKTIQEVSPTASDMDIVYLNLGNALIDLFFRTGNLTDLKSAIHMWEKAVAITPSDSPNMAKSLNALGNGLRHLYTFSKDDADLKRAIEALEQAVAKSQQKSLIPYYQNSLATCLFERYMATNNQPDLERAVDLLGQAKDGIPIKSTERPNILNSYSGALVNLYHKTRNRSDLERAIEVSREAVEEARHNVSRMYSFMSNLAEILVRRWQDTNDAGDAEEAVKLFRQAVRGLLDFEAEHALKSALSWGGWAFRREAWEEAAEAYGLGQLATEQLVRIQLLRSTKELWLKEASTLSANAAYALSKSGKLKDAVVALERGRASLLTEMLENGRANLKYLNELGHAELYNDYWRTSEKCAELMRVERLAAPSATTEAAKAKELKTARAQLEQTIAAIRKVPGYESFLLPLTFADIAALATKEPLIYIVSTRIGGLALIVRSDDVTSLWLPELTSHELADTLSNYLTTNILSKDSSNETALENWLQTLDAVTGWLWQRIMGPLLDSLEPSSEAILIPLGLLGLLPLHAAWKDDDSGGGRRQYALDKITFSYSPNARALAAARNVAKRTKDDSLLAVDEPQPVNAASLPSASYEIEAAAAGFETKRIFRHTDATRDNLLQALRDYSILHFSCHGFTDYLSPLEGGLLMANNEVLTLRDFLDLRLSGARLAILSACETGIPGLTLPDEVVNLPTSLMQAGVAGVIASLWSVSDLGTMMLMTRFYELWRVESLSPSEALRQAQIWLRDTTNGQKAAYFKNWLPDSTVTQMSSSVADELYEAVVLSDQDARDFSSTDYWAAFTYTGV